MPNIAKVTSLSDLVLDPTIQAKRIPGQATWDYFHPEDSNKRIRVIRKKDPVHAKLSIDITDSGIYMDGIALVPRGITGFAIEGESILKPLCWQNSSLQITRSLDKVKGTIIRYKKGLREIENGKY